MSNLLQTVRARSALAAIAITAIAWGSAAAQIIRVPAEQPTITMAIDKAGRGDTILIAPGTYRENIVLKGKAITLASWFLTTKNPAYVQQTVIQGNNQPVRGRANRETPKSSVVRVDRSQTEPVVFYGLTITGGDDCIASRGKFEFLHGRITGCTDGIDHQSGAVSVLRNSIFENNLDDGIDFDDDITVTVENNLIRNNNGDGIEIRLQPFEGTALLRSVIRGNTITGNQEDGIQIIDYPEVTKREFVIENNRIVDNRQAGIGCMNDAVTREDYRAAEIPEPIHLIDNYVQGNDRDISCGATVLARSGIKLQAAGQAVKPAAILLTWRNDPSTTVVVDWHMLPGTDAGRVEYRPVGAKNWASKAGEGFGFPFSERTVRRAELTGLIADTTYELRFGNGSQIYKYRTMPQTASRPIRFAVGGDTQASEESFGVMNRTIAKLDVDFVAFGGDLAYSNGNPSQVEREQMWYETITKTLITDDNRLIPVLPAIGNHEVFSPELNESQAASVFRRHGLKKGESPYYSALIAQPEQPYRAVDFGDYLSFLLLDSNHTRPVAGEQATWLAETLAKRETIPHVFPIYHVPGYPSVRKFEGGTSVQVREHWVPLFEKHGVRLVFENHDHVYKRTYPLLGNKRDPNGIVYLGDGAWGAGPREVARDHVDKNVWYLEKAVPSNHAILVTLDQGTAAVRVIDREGRVLDEYRTSGRAAADRN